MPRKPSSSLTVENPEHGRRPPPPSALSDRQKSLWVQITAAKPPDWFGPDTWPLLWALTAHTETFEDIQRELGCLDDLDPPVKRYWLDRLTKMRERETRAIASISTKLRLTQQSRYTPGAANTASKRHPCARPWEEPNPFLRIRQRRPRST